MSTERQFLRRTEKDKVSKETKDRFVQGLLRGLNPTRAGVFAGMTLKRARVRGSELMADEYVLQTLRFLRESMAEDELVTRNQVILNLVRLMEDDEDPTSTAAARVSAAKALSRIAGFDAPKKVSHNHVGGVMLLTQEQSADEWEKTAIAQQELLKQVARQ